MHIVSFTLYQDTVENEIHVITQCPLYDDIRNNLYAKATEADIAFNTQSDCDKLVFIFSCSSIIRIAAKSCYFILKRRAKFLYSI